MQKVLGACHMSLIVPIKVYSHLNVGTQKLPKRMIYRARSYYLSVQFVGLFFQLWLKAEKVDRGLAGPHFNGGWQGLAVSGHPPDQKIRA